MLKNVGVSPGISVGKVLVYENKPLSLSSRMITVNDVEAERQKVQKAIGSAVAELEGLVAKLDRQQDAVAVDLLEIHMELTADPMLVKKIDHYIEISYNEAGDAVQRAVADMSDMFTALEDEYYAARAVDIRDVGARIVSHILGVKRVDLSKLDDDYIIVAEDLTPSETITMDKKHVLGFITRQGSKTSHTAIVAKIMEIPAVVGVDISTITNGMTVIVDGSNGVVICNPTKEQLDTYREKQAKFKQTVQRLKELRELPAVTTDDREVQLFINISEPKEIVKLQEVGATGVGLYRTEFLYMNSSTMPCEDTQFNAYKEAAIRGAGQPIIIRTLDIGGDKTLEYLSIEPEENPFLGYRAIRLCLDNPNLFKTQLRAILRASAFGKLEIMFPMICSMSELKRAKQVLEECKSELDSLEILYDRSIKVGMMVEIPSVAAAADLFAKEVDFFSIGTNDLCQYALAVDRMNPKIAGLYQHFNPGVLRLIHNTIKAANNAGIQVGMCGEMASEPAAAVLLLGMGINELSMSCSSVPYVKDAIRNVTYQRAEQIVQEVLAMDSGIQIKNYVEGLIND